MNNLPESFIEARLNLVANLKLAMDTFKITPTSFAMMLNGISSSPVLSTEVTEWVDGKKLPNIYHLYKIASLLNIQLDSLFSSQLFPPEPDTTITAANSTGFVLITSSGPLVTANSTLQEKSTMANTKTTTVSITKNSKKKMEEVVRARTTSRNYNILLANKIYSSTMTLKDIANKVGISTRSLRDYSFYNTTVPANVATNLVKLFKTSYTQLGLMLNQDTNRYEHRQIVVKS